MACRTMDGRTFWVVVSRHVRVDGRAEGNRPRELMLFVAVENDSMKCRLSNVRPIYGLGDAGSGGARTTQDSEAGLVYLTSGRLYST